MVGLDGVRLRPEAEASGAGRLFGRGTATVETPTAVVGVKGTDVFVGYDDQAKLTQVIVLHGIVEVTSKNPQISAVTIQVGAGQFTEVGEDATPPQPRPAPVGHDERRPDHCRAPEIARGPPPRPGLSSSSPSGPSPASSAIP